MDHRPPWTEADSPPYGMTLETERLFLRPLRPGDLTALRTHLRRSAEHLRPWSPAAVGVYDTISLTSLSKLVVRHRHEWKAGVAYPFLVFLKTNVDGVVGRVTLSGVVRGVFQSAQLGYEVDVNHLGQGIATEAAREVVRFGFEVLDLHRVQAAIMPGNGSSLRVIEKCGFEREGLAKRYLCIAGAWEDHYLYGITYEDWLDRR